MLNIALKTERLILASFSKGAIDYLLENNLTNYSEWFGDQEINKYNSHGLFPQTKNELNDYFNRCENDKSLLSFMIINKETKKHIGMCSLQRIDWINRSAEFAIIIGEKDCWGKGYASESLQRLFEHGFMVLGLNRIWSATSILNKGMIRVFEKLGMKHEGTYRQGQFLFGKFEDVVAYAILRKEWNETFKN